MDRLKIQVEDREVDSRIELIITQDGRRTAMRFAAVEQGGTSRDPYLRDLKHSCSAISDVHHPTACC